MNFSTNFDTNEDQNRKNFVRRNYIALNFLSNGVWNNSIGAQIQII